MQAASARQAQKAVTAIRARRAEESGDSGETAEEEAGGHMHGGPLPPAQRRFKPSDSTLQTDGHLSRAFVLKFTRKCAEVLTSDESVGLLADCLSQPSFDGENCRFEQSDMHKLSMLSVAWQKELLEHLGVEMEHGCQALGQVPMRFQKDKEVISAFKAFTEACGKSADLAAQRKVAEMKEAFKKAEEAVGYVEKVAIN